MGCRGLWKEEVWERRVARKQRRRRSGSIRWNSRFV